MSFGWSAGDIATAIAVTYNLIQALNDAHGSAKDYREAVVFLEGLRRVLEPLQTFTDWSAYPVYGREIGQQVDLIKQPISEFLEALLKYESSLGINAQRCWQRRLPTVTRKLQWHIFMTKKVLSLKAKIESHMRILDSLMHQLTLDVSLTLQRTLPDTFRTTFEETIRPELVSILRGCRPLIPTLDSTTIQDTIIAKMTEHHQLISATIQDIKQQIASPEVIHQQIQSSLAGEYRIYRHKAISESQESCKLADQSCADSLSQSSSQVGASVKRMDWELLSEVYYLVFLYLGTFLKNLFLALSNLIQPQRALMPTLLAKYNISFLDAIGRPPRILPYEYFRSFKVLQAFIEHEFKDLPGSTWVNQGRYLVLSVRNRQALDVRNWSRSISPGSTVVMSILLRKRPELLPNQREERCPEPSCLGKWKKSTKVFLVTCPECEREVYTSVLEVSRSPDPATRSEDLNLPRHADSQAKQGSLEPAPYHDPEETLQEAIADPEDDDILHFKRVAHKTIPLEVAQEAIHPEVAREAIQLEGGEEQPFSTTYIYRGFTITPTTPSSGAKLTWLTPSVKESKFPQSSLIAELSSLQKKDKSGIAYKIARLSDAQRAAVYNVLVDLEGEWDSARFTTGTEERTMEWSVCEAARVRDEKRRRTRFLRVFFVKVPVIRREESEESEEWEESEDSERESY